MRIAAIGCATVLALCLLMGGCGAIYCVSTVNSEVNLRTQIAAKQKANEPSFDTMWKIISQKAQITGEYKDAFAKIYPDIMAGRYSTGGTMMKWVQEQNPNFDTSLYKDLMGSVEAERKRFLRDQEQLIDYNREREALINRFPSKQILGMFGNNTPIEIKIVTSSKSDEAFATGKDDDVDLFKKDTPKKAEKEPKKE